MSRQIFNKAQSKKKLKKICTVTKNINENVIEWILWIQKPTDNV